MTNQPKNLWELWGYNGNIQKVTLAVLVLKLQIRGSFLAIHQTSHISHYNYIHFSLCLIGTSKYSSFTCAHMKELLYDVKNGEIQIPEYVEGWSLKKQTQVTQAFWSDVWRNHDAASCPPRPKPGSAQLGQHGVKAQLLSSVRAQTCSGCLTDTCTASCKQVPQNKTNGKAAVPGNTLAPTFPGTTAAYL